jgi:hypothetical protein
MSAQILQFPTVAKLERLAENLWLMRLDNTPESQAQAERIIAELRTSNYVVPDYMKGDYSNETY